MNKRLEMLTQLVESGSADSFTRYALELEHKKAGQPAAALGMVQTLRELDPSFLAMYYMAGQMLLDLSRDDDARDWFEAGIEVARAQRNDKTLAELEAALAEL